MIKALFVCRGSAAAGLGHVMRCGTVAVEMARRARVRLVAIGDPFIGHLLADTGVAFEVVGQDADVLPEYRGFDPDIVVFDLLNIAPVVFDTVAKQCLTVCLSPIFRFLERVDLVFSRARPRADLLGPKVFCGPQYAVISRHCKRLSTETYIHNLQADPLAVAVSLGGTDPPNKTLEVLSAVQELPDRTLFWVLLGEGYSHSYQKLVDCVSRSRRHEVILAKTSASMWRILGGCAVAVLAGGITAYEAAYAGLPSINTLEQAGDRHLIADLETAGVCLYAGAPLKPSLPVITETLARLGRNRDELLAMHHGSRALLDDKAAERIVDRIVEIHRSMVAADREVRAWASV